MPLSVSVSISIHLTSLSPPGLVLTSQEAVQLYSPPSQRCDNLAVASDLTFDLTSLSEPCVPPVTLELGPDALPLGIALCEHAFSSLCLISLAQ